MKALVIGASGQVGRYLLREFGAKMDAVGTWSSRQEEGLVHFDLADEAECARVLGALRPTHILLPGAVTHVDWCEDNAEWCYAVNVGGVRTVSAVARELGSQVVLFSTDQVFGESERPLREDDPVGPLNVYARSKVLAEEAVRAALPETHLIIRTGWVYGVDRQQKNFVYSLCRRVRAGESVAVVADQWGSPTYAYDLARATLALVSQGASGTYHVVGPEWMTRHAFAVEICRAFGLPETSVRGVPTEALGQRARRPRRCRLDATKFGKATAYPMTGPRLGLRHMQEDVP